MISLALLQLMVAAQCHRSIYYSAFHDARLQRDIHSFHDFCTSNNTTVGKLTLLYELALLPHCLYVCQLCYCVFYMVLALWLHMCH